MIFGGGRGGEGGDGGGEGLLGSSSVTNQYVSFVKLFPSEAFT